MIVIFITVFFLFALYKGADVNTALIFCSYLASLLTLSNKNMWAAFLLLTLTLSFNTIGDLITAENMYYYYWGAAMNDLVILYILSKFPKPTRLIKQMQRLSIGFIAVNIIGWALYEANVSYTEFILMYTFMYIGLLLTILNNGDHHALGVNGMGSKGHLFFSNNPSRDYVISTHKKEARN